MSTTGTKIIVITGATEGLGLATAMSLARQGHQLLLHGRNAAKLSTTLKAVQGAGAASGTRTFSADYSSLAEVRGLAKEIAGAVDHVDVLINNAAAMFATRQETKDGLEANFGINSAAPLLLTLELLPRLAARSGSRIVNVSSVGCKQAKPNFDDLQSRTGYGMQPAYFNSKLFNLYNTLSLAERWSASSTTVNAVHPGGVQTQLARDFRGPMKWIFAAKMPLFFVTPEKGAETSVFLATDPSVATVSGKYFVKSAAEPLTAIGTDINNRRKCWELMVALLEKQAGFVLPPQSKA